MITGRSRTAWVARSLIAAALALVLGVVACAKKNPELPPGSGAGQEPVRGGTIVVGLAADPEVLMPYATRTASASNIVSWMFLMLADTEADLMSWKPSLASSWEWSDDRLSLTMHLRTDVLWHDGVQATAEDVAFTFDVARDSTVAWSSRPWKTTIRTCDVVDRFTVRFTFDEIFADQFRFAREGFVVPKHLLQDVPRDRWGEAPFGRAPVGNGPFRFESWEPQQSITLVRNEKYFDSSKPYVDRVVFRIVPDASSRVAQLRAGELDVVEDLSGADAAAILRQEDEAHFPAHITRTLGRAYDFIGYNSRDPLFENRGVREALTRAVNRQAIVDNVCHGFGQLFEGPVVPIIWAYAADRPLTPYDPAGASRLLSAAGWADRDGDGWLDRDGRKFEFEVLVASDNQMRRDALVLVQSDWKKIGIKANIRGMERTAGLKLRGNRQYQAFCGGWNAGLTVNLTSLWGCESIHRPHNFTEYCNPRVDSLNAAALRLPMEEAKPLWHEAQKLVAQDYPYTWLYYLQQYVGTSKRLQGAVIDHRGVYNNPEGWWLTQERPAGN